MVRILAIIIFTLTITIQYISSNDYQTKYNPVDSPLSISDTELPKPEHYGIPTSMPT